MVKEVTPRKCRVSKRIVATKAGGEETKVLEFLLCRLSMKRAWRQPMVRDRRHRPWVGGLDQNMSFPANHHCLWPPLPPKLALVVTSVEVMAPKFPPLMFEFGLPK